MTKPGWIATAQQSGKRYQDRLERRPWIAFPLESLRRFNKIEGKHLALVIALNLFVAVIPPDDHRLRVHRGVQPASRRR